MTIRTTNNQTVGREVFLQLREKPITGRKTTNETQTTRKEEVILSMRVKATALTQSPETRHM